LNTAVEQPAKSPQSRDLSAMENLRRKLSVARGAENAHMELARELNQYRQNNAALQKQIESLMAKLTQSKQNEKKLSNTLEKVEKNCNEWQEKARIAEREEKGKQALQDDIDHLAHRLEIANSDKLDAQEELFNLRSQRGPFDPLKSHSPGAMMLANNRQSTRTSMSTIFEAHSPQEVELQVTLDVMPEEQGVSF
jgi:chromosome segregation ATPase